LHLTTIESKESFRPTMEHILSFALDSEGAQEDSLEELEGEGEEATIE
jgi:hypothetical protein